MQNVSRLIVCQVKAQPTCGHGLRHTIRTCGREAGKATISFGLPREALPSPSQAGTHLEGGGCLIRTVCMEAAPRISVLKQSFMVARKQADLLEGSMEVLNVLTSLTSSIQGILSNVVPVGWISV